jgi:hypothetical protein
MMNKPIKTFCYGIACAALIAAAGYTNTFRLESNLHELELACIGQGRLDNKFVDIAPPLCDSESLVNGSGASNAIQAKIIQIQHEVWSSKEWPYFMALSVVVLFMVPLLWYFLSRIVRRLIYAVVGSSR